MMQDWNAWATTPSKPEVMHGLWTIDNAAAKTGKLEPRIHELIALRGRTRRV